MKSSDSDISRSTLLRRYFQVMEIAQDLASTLDLDTLLNRIVHAAASLSDSVAASILLYDGANNQLHFHSSTNLDTPLMRGLVVPVEGSIAGDILTTRQPIIVHLVEDDPRHFKEIGESIQFKTESLLGVPLITKDKVVGVLEALNKRVGRFTLEDQELLTALASQAAVAIENARLFQQSDLIAEMVHEVRTPLASINTAAHLLQRPEISEEQKRKLLETIQGETRRLSEMTTSFLDLARLESGRTPFAVEEVELAGLLNEATETMQSKIRERDLLLEVDIPARLPTIKGDRDKLKQVALNLLSNATKYNRPGGKISIEAQAGETELSFSVRDTGRGILPEHLGSLFEKFYRVPGAEQVAQGTGLGLSICKKIVESHGGKIEVESEIGVGTVFTVHLPLS